MDENDRLLADELPDDPSEGRVTASPELIEEWEEAQELAASRGRLRLTLRDLPANDDSWRWVGSLAHRYKVLEIVRELLDEKSRPAFDTGAAALARLRPVPRPAVNETTARRVMRGVKALSDGPRDRRRKRDAYDEARSQAESITITELVRRSAGSGLGGRVDLVLNVGGSRVRLTGLDGATLTSYQRITARAAEEGLLLPPLGKHARTLWTQILGPALKDAKCERTHDGEDVRDAIAEEIVEFLADEPGDSVLHLEQGGVVANDGQLVAQPRAVIRYVRSSLADDAVTREDVVTVARRLGMTSRRVHLLDGRPRVWAFPVSAAKTKADDGSAA